MEYSTYPHILSDREQKEWILGCPVQVKRVKLTVPGEGSGIVLSAMINPCGSFTVEMVEALVEFEDARRKKLPSIEKAVFTLGESEAKLDAPIPCEAVYAYLTVHSVKMNDGTVWENSDGGKGSVLPEQKVIWQTESLYEAIRAVCSGVVDAKYYPDEPMSGTWRCACGQVNLHMGEEDVCGACGCGRKWLWEHFDEAYLSEYLKSLSVKKTETVKKKPKKKKEGISDKAKFILILAAAAVVITGLALTPYIGKVIRYSKAEEYLQKGDYDRAIEAFTKLEGFSDSNAKLQEANYKKAQEMTGMETVNMVWSSRYPCYSITPDGVLSFRKDNYTGDWNHFIIPDVVDGIVVRELDKNFFLNCKDLRKVTISDCVEVIGDGAFFNCEKLTSIQFGKNVKRIGATCFINCTLLSEITIPDTVEKIGVRAFNNCTQLENVTLGQGITVLPDYLFSNCIRLKTVKLTAPVTAIGEYAFDGCGLLEELVYPGTKAMWAEVAIEGNNTALQEAKIVFTKK